MKVKMFLMITVFTIFCACCAAYAQERIQLNTYYPSPGGRYEKLRTYCMGVGDNYGVGSGPDIPTGVPLIQGLTGTIGVGTPNPQEKLEIRGYPYDTDAGDRNRIRITNQTATGTYVAHSIISHDNTGPYVQVSNNANRWSVRKQNNTQVLTVELDTNYVGINKTNPESNLDVIGTFRIYGVGGTAALRLERPGLVREIQCNGGDFSITNGEAAQLLAADYPTRNVAIGAAPANYRLRIVGGPLYAQGGLIIHFLDSTSEAGVNSLEATLLLTAEDGQIWLREQF